MLDYFDKDTFDNAIHADNPVALWIASNGGPRLLAAAPDLLEELIAAQAALAMVYAGRTNWHGHLATLETVSAAMKSARAAIAKAEGSPE